MPPCVYEGGLARRGAFTPDLPVWGASGGFSQRAARQPDSLKRCGLVFPPLSADSTALRLAARKPRRPLENPLVVLSSAFPARSTEQVLSSFHRLSVVDGKSGLTATHRFVYRTRQLTLKVPHTTYLPDLTTVPHPTTFYELGVLEAIRTKHVKDPIRSHL
ncbi:hypothetical protein RB213_010544 [Colletotrichum asianum]